MRVNRSIPVVAPNRAIRVLPVAEVRLYREGLASSLACRDDISIVGTAGTRDEALALIASAQPDVVVLDMAIRDSLQVVRALASVTPSVKVIAFAIEGLDEEILACAEAGVAGYIHCDASMDEFVAAIEGVMRGELRCPPRTAAMLLRHLASLARGEPERLGSLRLTAREQGVVVLIDDGLSNKEIAGRLHIEVATVKNHVHSILDKLHVTTRAEAAAHLRRSTAYGSRLRWDRRWVGASLAWIVDGEWLAWIF